MNKAIITAFTQNFWQDFLIYYDSIKRISNVLIYVTPLELDERHRSLLEQMDVEIIDYVNTSKMKDHFGKKWVQWSKAFIIQELIKQSNKKYVLWLDVDTVIVKPLEDIFNKIKQDFVIINDYFAPNYCLNDEKLYDDYPAPIPNHQKKHAINSGVVGFEFPRDNYILESWVNNTKKVIDNQNLKKYITLYDQGILLWSMRELKIINKALPYKSWNYPAKRNCYEYCTKSADNNITPNYKWPEPNIPRMGGDIIDEITLDNPHAVITHFAGTPKLSHLCKIDHHISKHHISHKKTERIFCVGLERCGTHTIAEAIRRSVICESWVRHEFAPVLAKEVELKITGRNYRTPALQNRFNIYNRSDTALIFESNHRLGFFIPEIEKEVAGSKFLLLLRNPVELLRSRFRNYSYWASHQEIFPKEYLSGLEIVSKNFKNGSYEQNVFRPVPNHNFNNWEPAELHIWEIIETLELILQCFSKIERSRYDIIWLEDISNYQIDEFIFNKLDILKFKKWASIKFGNSFNSSPESSLWIEEQIVKYRDKLTDRFIEILYKYDISPPASTYM